MTERQIKALLKKTVGTDTVRHPAVMYSTNTRLNLEK